VEFKKIPATLSGDVSVSMVKPIAFLLGEIVIEENLVRFLKVVLSLQNDFLSGLVVMLYSSHS